MKYTLNKESVISVGLMLALSGILISAVWWASNMDTRLRSVEERVQPIPQIQQDLAVVKNILLGGKQVVKTD